MKTLATYVLVFFATIALYLLFWPVAVQPVSWQAPVDEGFTGAFSPNDILKAARPILLGDYLGPEDVAVGADAHLYASTYNGVILRISPDGRDVSQFADVGGRPLGIEADADGNLLVANATLGLQRVSNDSRVESLLDTVAGHTLAYADDVAVAPNGRIYLTEASRKFAAAERGGTLEASLLDLLEHGGHGLLIEFDPATGAATVLVDGLNFANGVAVSPDGQFLLLAETGSYRILKYWLQGDRAGSTEVIIDNLPGFPDNINNGRNGRYWIGLIAPRNALLDKYSDRPFVRKVMQRLPTFLRPKPEYYSHVIAIDGNGEVLMSLQDPDGLFPMLTGALESESILYLTTLIGNGLPAINKRDLL